MTPDNRFQLEQAKSACEIARRGLQHTAVAATGRTGPDLILIIADLDRLIHKIETTLSTGDDRADYRQARGAVPWAEGDIPCRKMSSAKCATGKANRQPPHQERESDPAARRRHEAGGAPARHFQGGETMNATTIACAQCGQKHATPDPVPQPGPAYRQGFAAGFHNLGISPEAEPLYYYGFDESRNRSVSAAILDEAKGFSDGVQAATRIAISRCDETCAMCAAGYTPAH